mmetsp:Transcript_7020/g.30862  ORF Transcript_7020/g.30862 Transcript_7020/m.30862 type:complete len:252 (-) Transcript_7020:1103-1858(-)
MSSATAPDVKPAIETPRRSARSRASSSSRSHSAAYATRWSGRGRVDGPDTDGPPPASPRCLPPVARTPRLIFRASCNAASDSSCRDAFLETHTTAKSRAIPESALDTSRVNFESRHGTCDLESARASTHRPNALTAASSAAPPPPADDPFLRSMLATSATTISEVVSVSGSQTPHPAGSSRPRALRRVIRSASKQCTRSPANDPFDAASADVARPDSRTSRSLARKPSEASATRRAQSSASSATISTHPSA